MTITAANAEAAVAAYKAGKNAYEVGREMSISTSAIYKMLKAAGIKARRHGKLTDEQRAAIVAEYIPHSHTASFKALGAKYGVSSIAIFKIVNAARG